jgi:hypothetical protein
VTNNYQSGVLDSSAAARLTLPETVRVALEKNCLWVPNRSSMSCNLGVFVDQSAEPVAASETKMG